LIEGVAGTNLSEHLKEIAAPILPRCAIFEGPGERSGASSLDNAAHRVDEVGTLEARHIHWSAFPG
jgi:hypothetical protein